MTIISTQYASGIVNATEKAAIAASKLIGLGDEKAADQVAVDAMRTALNDIDFKGRIVIGEGERDEAPMLYIGEQLGTLNGPEFDIAVDPLEGTKFTANNEPNAFSVLSAENDSKQYANPFKYSLNFLTLLDIHASGSKFLLFLYSCK